MATATPPGASRQAPLQPPERPGAATRRGPVTAASVLAAGGLAAVVAVIAYLLLSGGGGTTYHLMFESADELVRGDQVQVGGVPVGSVKDIVLTHDYKAEVTIEVSSPLAPLHRGTTAQIRVPSLSSVANRYIALAPGPNNMPALPSGSTLPTTKTKGAVNLDQLFNTLNPETRKGLQQLIDGFAKQYEGVSHDVNLSTSYFPPALRETAHFFEEVTRDEHVLSSFLVEGAKAVGTIAAHGKQLSGVIDNGAQALKAIGSEQSKLEAGVKELPRTFREGNRTFAKLPEALAALRQLVEVSKPNTKTLAPFFERLTPLLSEATPVLHELSVAIDKPGPNNDLTDFALSLPGLAKSLKTASPNGVKALEESVPITTPLGPYAPDLVGLLHDFGQSTAYRDANGQYVRVSPDFADFKLSEGKLTPVSPEEGLEGLKTGQLRRCPGSATQPAEDGSSPFTDEGKLGCDPAEVP